MLFIVFPLQCEGRNQACAKTLGLQLEPLTDSQIVSMSFTALILDPITGITPCSVLRDHLDGILGNST